MITYLEGDATDPQGLTPHENKIIAHVCNDIGAWGRGFVLSLSKRWPHAEKAYRRWYQEQEDYVPDVTISDQTVLITGNGNRDNKGKMMLGTTQIVPVHFEPNFNDKPATHITYVANMIAQAGIFSKNNVAPIRYDAVEGCLHHVATFARIKNASVHMPRIGCGLAGGEWSKIEPVLERTLDEIKVFVYDFKSSGDARTVAWKQ